MAEETDFKAVGNEAFTKKKYGLAIRHYTKGIKQDPHNHVLYSNRCAAFLKMSKDHKGLADAEMCVKLKPDWAKGHYRKGCALKELLDYDGALAAFKKAVELAPNDREIRNRYNEVFREVKSKGRKQAIKLSESKDPSEFESFQGQFIQTGPQIVEAKQEPTSTQNGEGTQVDEPLEFATKAIQIAISTIIAGDELHPLCQFLTKDKSVRNAGIEKAFDSPETYSNCAQFLRKFAQDISANSVIAVVPKSFVAFPKVWMNKNWKHSASKGVFVQLEAKEHKKTWFFPYTSTNGVNNVGSVEELDASVFSIMPRLIYSS